MKTILMFRHAESSYGTQYSKDHDRPLTVPGINDAGNMGVFLKRNKLIPELVISSSANRAITTANIAHKTGEWNSKIIIEPNIYGGNPSFLINLINNQNDKYKSICLVGHEPNFSSFIEKCTNIDYINLSTASAAKIDFDTNSWKDIEFGYAKLVLHKEPRDLLIEEGE